MYYAESYKIISIHRFPNAPDQYTTPNLSLFQSQTHGPLISYVYPGDTTINLMAIEHLGPRQRPAFQCQAEKRLLGDPAVAIGNGVSLADVAGRLRLGGRDDGGIEEDDDEEALFENEVNNAPVGVRSEDMVPPSIDCRRISIEFAKGRSSEETLINCAVGLDGQMIVGVGTKGSVWVWRYDETM